jgi:hypothetical protein
MFVSILVDMAMLAVGKIQGVSMFMACSAYKNHFYLFCGLRT